MFQLDQIDHVALTVQSVERSVAWYGEVLGLVRRHQEVWGDCPAVMYAGSTGLALFPAESGPSPPPDPRRTAIMRHLAFRVDRIHFRRAQADLTGRQIPFTIEDHTISRSIYLRDPDGYEIEITTYDLE